MPTHNVSRLHLCVVAFMPLILACCAERDAKCQAKVDMLKQIEGRDAQVDARHAIESRDSRYLGVFGFTTDVPGMEGHRDLVKEHGLRMIEGTTDAPCDEEHRRLVSVVRTYAESYNLELYKLESGKTGDR